MADIEKISVGGTSYDVRDALAAHTLSDIAVAGDNITFSKEFSYNMQKQGEPTLVDGTATGFSSTKYLYETNLPDDNVTYYFKIKMPSSLTWADIIRYGEENKPLLFLFAIWDEGDVNSLCVWNETTGIQEVIIPQISANMTYWLKVQISGDEKTYSYSTDGTNYTQSLVVNDPQTVSRYLRIGGGEHSGFSNGTVYLNECYAISGDTEVWRGATLSNTSINTTVDQTYNASSANAQSGVAINGAGFLKNAATGSNSICILGNASGDANGSRSVAIGTDSYASQNNCVAIGNYAAATGYTSVAVGMCQATANYAIQLGSGKNGNANTFSVGLSSSLNVRLLNSDGTIPGERMALQGTEAPTTSTAGSIGQFYVDTTNQIGYICVSAADSTYVWKQITA